MLQAHDLHFSYNDVGVLKGVSLDVSSGEIVALLGASGCGKSTLLRALAGLEDCKSGEINWLNSPTFSFVFQEPSLMPWATVEANVALPLTLANRKNPGLIQSTLKEVGLEGFEGRYPSSLSGGQKMRVSIARALAAEPSLMFLDEPFAALDEILRFQMNELLLSVRRDHALTCFFVTHSVYEAAYLADRILIMKNGKIVSCIEPNLDRTLSAADQRSSEAFFSAARDVAQALEEERV